MKRSWRFVMILMSIVGTLLFTQAQDAMALATSSRLAGADRYLTAIEVSKEGWPEGAETVILTNGLDFPDALSAAPLAKKYNAPILLTKAERLNEDTAVEIKRLKAKKVVLVGGEGVLSPEVVDQLKKMGIPAASITRLAGANRYDTSLAVANAVGVGQGVFVTGADFFHDALSIATIAAAKGMPILLVPSDEPTTMQKGFLSKVKIPSAVLVGETGQFSANVMSYFPNQESLLGGDTYERNAKLIERYSKDLNLNTAYVATGMDFPDGLAASALAPKNRNPLFILNGNYVPYTARNFIGENVITEFVICGGTGVISSSTENTLKSLPAQFTTFKNLTVRIQEKQKYDPPKTVTMKKSTGEWEEVEVTWSLSNVSTLRAGTYTYEGQVKGYGGTVYLTLIVDPIPSKTTPITAEIVQGDSYYFPDSVPVVMSDNVVRDYPVIWSTNVVTMNKVGSYTFQGAIEGTSLKVTLTLKVSEDSVIAFTDSGLEAVVRDELNRGYSRPIYKRDVLGITSLDADSYGITDLTGLETFTNLVHLDLEDNNLTGAALSPLEKLMNLKYLNLENNDLDQITSLKGLTNLTFLDVSGNVITDFSPLKGMIRLNTLYLTGNATRDYSPLRPIYNSLSSHDFTL